MKRIFLLLILCPVVSTSIAQSGVPVPEVQIKSALLAAPADKKDNATVYGYSANKEFILLRKGSNELICLADDPKQAEFSVACYHRDLDPFMQRGRDLRKLGKSTKEIFDTREKEVKAGKLIMPKQPATLFVYTATDKNYDHTTGEVKDGYLRYVIYIPYATSESTGLPLKPEGPSMPWIMNPGTHGAHIMISPPMNNSPKK
ncbi:MAG: hypothetical protein ABI760_21795 [Ferruginibacter sp.]